MARYRKTTNSSKSYKKKQTATIKRLITANNEVKVIEKQCEPLIASLNNTWSSCMLTPTFQTGDPNKLVVKGLKLAFTWGTETGQAANDTVYRIMVIQQKTYDNLFYSLHNDWYSTNVRNDMQEVLNIPSTSLDHLLDYNSLPYAYNRDFKVLADFTVNSDNSSFPFTRKVVDLSRKVNGIKLQAKDNSTYYNGGLYIVYIAPTIVSTNVQPRMSYQLKYT